MIIRPEEMSKRDAYRFFISAIIPRPIAWVSTISLDGRRNLAPFSFFNGISAKPPLVSIAIGRRKGRAKDTAQNAIDTSELVVNLATMDTAASMNMTSGDYPPDIDEFRKAGLTPIPSLMVKPPRVKESPVSMECRLDRSIGLAEDSVTLLIAEVVLVHVEDRVMGDGGSISWEELRAVGRLGGSGYCKVTDVFDMERPKLNE